jgi:hypothetical protein
MKRRRFITALAAAPAAPALLAQQAIRPTTESTPPAAPAPPANPPGFGAQNVPKIEVTVPDGVAETEARFFSAQQFAALRRLSEVLLPPLKGNPGALDCGTPEFLDFLTGASPADRQQLYKNGLDALNTRAKKQFGKPFAELDATQADAIIRPLLVPVPWAKDPPKDPLQHFMTTAHDDIRTATRNSREWSATSSNGRPRGGGGGLYWNPIDPVYKG